MSVELAALPTSLLDENPSTKVEHKTYCCSFLGLVVTILESPGAEFSFKNCFTKLKIFCFNSEYSPSIKLSETLHIYIYMPI